MRVFRLLDKKASNTLVHPSLEDENCVTPRSVNRAKVMDLLGVTSTQEQVEVDVLLSATSNGEHSCVEDAEEDVCESNQSVVAVPHQPLPSKPACMVTADNLNALGKGKYFQLPVAKTQFVQGLATSHWGVKLLDFQRLANMSVLLNNPSSPGKPSTFQLHSEKGVNNSPTTRIGQGRTFPLPPRYPEKHLLPSPQRKDELPVAHPLPQPPLSRSSPNQPSQAQVHDRKANTSSQLQSANELSSREAVPLPSAIAETAKAGQVSSMETFHPRFIASMVHKACSTASSPAREFPRPCHLLPSPPIGGPMLHSPSPSPSLSPTPRSKPLCPRKWRKGAVLGQGTFGIVHEGLNLEDGSFFAVKVSSTDAVSPEIQQEVDLLSKLEHPNIVRYLGSSIQEEGRLCIFLELVRMGSLETILRKYKRFEENTIRSYTRQILHGLEYLHAQKTIHRDIKCANILVDVNGQVKLSDFGLAKQVGETLAYSSKGTPLFMAPEVLTPRQNCYSFSADIWSLGCSVLEMADGKPPWSNLEGFGFFFKVKKGELPPMPEHLSPEGRDFVCRCLKFNAKDRPTASELLQHPFVTPVSSPDVSITWACSSPPFSSPGANNRKSAERPAS